MAKIRTTEGMSKIFGSDISVKQGYSSPTLFGLYIHKLEELLDKSNDNEVQLANYVNKLLIYVDNLNLVAKAVDGLREHSKVLETFS